jgi:probable F420-dependent oxidoreductase
VQLPTDRVEQGDEFFLLDHIAEIASAIEAAGFDACYVTEHPMPSDIWLKSGGHHSLDPFVALTVAAAATQTLQLHTNLIVVPYRNPFLTAKSIASLDAVSGGRVIMGVGTGYSKEEYEALGADFPTRNDTTDEALVAMKEAWRGESVAIEGHTFTARANTALPVPVRQPHPPIWVGGNSQRAIRRAVEHGQGWSPFPLPQEHAARVRTSSIETIEDLAAGIERLNETAIACGRNETLDVNFVPFGHGMNSQKPIVRADFCEQVDALEGIGVTWLSLGLPGASRSAYLESIAKFGEEVIQ